MVAAAATTTASTRALVTAAAAATPAATSALLSSRRGAAAALPVTVTAAAATTADLQHHQQLRFKSSALARLRRLQRRRTSRPGTQASWAAVRPLLDALKGGGGGQGNGGGSATQPSSSPSPPPARLVPTALSLHETRQGGEAEQHDDDDESAPPQVSVVGRIAAPYLPPQPQDAFAVVQIGPFQYKVSAGDVVFHPRLKGCEVNDVLALGRVLLAGGKEATAVGRPFVPGASVVAAVEEHFKDAKVRVFKKKKRKRYSRSYGHRSLVTALRVLEVRCAEVGAGEAGAATTTATAATA
jgi:large subunit ribosomal protein L21